MRLNMRYMCKNQLLKYSKLNQNVTRNKSSVVNASNTMTLDTKDSKPVLKSIQDVSLPDFLDHKTAYQSKGWGELVRAYTVFKLCSIDWLVDHQSEILQWSERLLGTRLYRWLMRHTMYPQFLAGDTNGAVVARARRAANQGLLPMFAYTAAEVHGDVRSSMTRDDMKKLFDTNFDAIHNCIEIASESAKGSHVRAKASSKLTFLTLPYTLENLTRVMWEQQHMLNDPSNQNLIGKVIQNMQTTKNDTFVAPNLSKSTSEEKLLSLATNIHFHMEMYNVRKELDLVRDEDLKLEDETVHDILTLTNQMNSLAEHAVRADVRLVWDAEQTYLQEAIDGLVLDSMRRFNTRAPVITNTYQCYRKCMYDIVKRDFTLASAEGFSVGLKVVRGAYIVEERRLAQEQNYEDPINPDYDATSSMYYSVVDFLLNNIKNKGVDCMVIFATHNLDTVIHIVQRMKELDITPNGNDVTFAQLLGMRDHITYPLGQVGLPASKLFHYGPVLDGVAYLSRRVTENRGGVGTANLERDMLGREIRHRLMRRGAK